MDWNPLEGENNLNIYMDASSIKVFVNGGQSELTAQFFNLKPYTHIEIFQPLEELLVLEHFEIRPLESI